MVQNLILFKMNFMRVYFVRAILSHFYKDEVEYTETVNRLFEVIKYCTLHTFLEPSLSLSHTQVYSPILQYTGAFIQIQELVDFQL